jgi:hypothetical protein
VTEDRYFLCQQMFQLPVMVRNGQIIFNSSHEAGPDISRRTTPCIILKLCLCVCVCMYVCMHACTNCIHIKLRTSLWFHTFCTGVFSQILSTLMMEAEIVSETLDHNSILTRPIILKAFAAFSCRESFKTYINNSASIRYIMNAIDNVVLFKPINKHRNILLPEQH